MRAVAADNYTYAETNYANPHALTAFFNGSATTTYAYDANGNLASTTGAATSTFNWDYRNRMIRAWVSGATSTYAYDHTTARMRQVVGSTTTDYPNKFFSIATTTLTAATSTATSTAFIWHGDVLVATIEQALINGVATGIATTYYVHPDHLGSTNAITNSAGTVKQALDYYPYGAPRINTGTDASDRRFIGQFTDDATSLDYLNARYYDPARGQFLSQDPTHLAIGDAAATKAISGGSRDQLLADPQVLNSYAYSRGNPLRYSDPKGEFPVAGALIFALTQYGAAKSGVATGYAWSVNYGPYSSVFSDAEKSRASFAAGYEWGTLGLGVVAPAVKMGGAGVAVDSLGATLDVGDTYFGDAIYARYNKNHEGELEGVFKSAKELKSTTVDKARYKVGLMGSGPMSSANTNNVAGGQNQNQANNGRSYAQSVAAWTKVRDGLAGVLKQLQSSR